MNFLAHLLLSGSPATTPNHAEIVLGNFAAEAVRGRAALAAYPAAVQRGIWLHRFIDSFTDAHPLVRRTTARLRGAGLGKWAGVVSDVGFDHLLARDFAHYHPDTPSRSLPSPNATTRCSRPAATSCRSACNTRSTTCTATIG